MLIKYFGHSYFLIEGNDYSIALDPFGDIGLYQPKVKANYVFKSHEHFDHNAIELVSNAKLIENSDSRFEIIKSYHDEVLGKKRGYNNILKFKLDGKIFVFLGDLGCITEEVISKIKNCHYLLIPVGGTYTIDKFEAKLLIEKANPKTVIPMHYKLKGCTVNVDSVDNFLNLFNEIDEVKSPYTLTGNEKQILYIKAEV